MIKKIICILFVSIFVVFFGCSRNYETEENTQSETYTLFFDTLRFDMLQNPYITEKGTHYTVYKTSSSDIEKQYYWYKIYDESNNVLLEGGTVWKVPCLKQSGSIVSVSVSMGTLDTRWKFCNTETGEISDVFSNILAVNQTIACRFDPVHNRLIIFDVFNSSKNIAEIKADFSSRAGPVFEAEFLSNHKIKFSYYAADEQEKTSEAYF